MRPFRYESAVTTRRAVELMVSAPGAAYLAGGTNLVDLMKLGVERPELLIDVSRLPLDAMQESPNGGVIIGAAVRNAAMSASPLVQRVAPLAVRAVVAGASGQLRNMATVGGNLLQRTRCPWFVDVRRPCNMRNPGSGCSAINGDHRTHAILGVHDDCIAVHPSDLAVALAALDAIIHVEDAGGPRTIPIAELYPPVDADPHVRSQLDREALITAVEVPPTFDGASAYRKVRDRASYAFALVSVAAQIDVRDGVVADVRLAFGGVARVPWRARAAEAVLLGRPATVEQFARAADAELAAATPLRDNAYKVPMLHRVLVRTLTDLTGGSA